MRLITSLLLFLGSCVVCLGQNLVPTGFEAWSLPIEQRISAGSFSRTKTAPKILVAGLRNEVVSAQLAFRNDKPYRIQFNVSPLKGSKGNEIPADAVRVRLGAFLPVDETAQFTADPLVEVPSQPLPANLSQALWISLRIPKAARADKYLGTLRLAAEGASLDVPLEVEVLEATLPDPPEYAFYLNLWQDPNGVARAHKVSLWSEAHWRLLAEYARNLAEHGQKSIMTSILHDPWNAQTGYEFPSMVEWKYPGEWKSGGAASFTWDFSIFDRYVTTMVSAGVRGKIDMYAMVKGPGPTPDASIRYYDTRAKTYRTESLNVGDPKWREAWMAFLPALRAHLKEKGWWSMAYLGFDEKPKEIMDQLSEFIRQAGPDFRLVLSGGHAEASANNEVVLHWDNLQDAVNWSKQFGPLVQSMREKSQLVSFYTACEPRFPNLFLYSTLREARMLAWVSWKFGLGGYTRWAVNAYPEDVWTQPNFKWHSGDMYLQYPGEAGPLDGMRWELLRQGIQDYEALRIAHEMSTFWGRPDLLKLLEGAVEKATILDSCRDIPQIEEARKIVNQVLREISSPDEMGKKAR